MSVKRDQIPVTSPCPITLDRSGVEVEDREMFCRHCSKDVHLLSHMTEREARELMQRRAGDDICVSYAVRADGSIRFRPEPQLVPAVSLVRRGLSMAASIGAAALIAACTPHEGEADRQIEENSDKTHAQVQVEPERVEPPPTPEIAVAGGLMAEPLPPDQPCDPEQDVQVDGGIKAMPVDPAPIPDNGADVARMLTHVRGGGVAKPIDPLALD